MDTPGKMAFQFGGIQCELHAKQDMVWLDRTNMILLCEKCRAERNSESDSLFEKVEPSKLNNISKLIKSDKNDQIAYESTIKSMESAFAEMKAYIDEQKVKSKFTIKQKLDSLLNSELNNSNPVSEGINI